MKKFTEGPWNLEFGNAEIRYREHSINTEYGLLAVVDAGNYGGWRDCEDEGESEFAANARLISRSPEMYSALERILFRCNSFLDDERDMSQDSIAAIAMICTRELKKARGEE